MRIGRCLRRPASERARGCVRAHRGRASYDLIGAPAMQHWRPTHIATNLARRMASSGRAAAQPARWSTPHGCQRRRGAGVHTRAVPQGALACEISLAPGQCPATRRRGPGAASKATRLKNRGGVVASLDSKSIPKCSWERNGHYCLPAERGGAPTVQVATMYGREHQSPAAALAAAHRLASRCDLSVLPPLAPRRPPLGGMYAQGGGSGSWGPRASHELPMMGRLWPKRTDGGDGASGCLSCLDSVVWDLQGHRGCVRVQQPSCIRRGSPAPL